MRSCLWRRTSTLNEEDVLHPNDSDLGGTVVDEPAEFLRTELAAGPVPTPELRRSARNGGISRSSLRRAREAMKLPRPVKTAFKAVVVSVVMIISFS
jgi:hypothetical protein